MYCFFFVDSVADTTSTTSEGTDYSLTTVVADSITVARSNTTMTVSLVSRLSLSFSHFFARANFIREKSKERESLVRNPAHPWLPGQGLGGHTLHCAFYCSRTAFWTVLTSLTDDKDYLGESFLGKFS